MFAGAVGPWRDDGLGADLAQCLVEVVGGVSLVGDKGGGPQSIMQSRGLNDGAPVAWGRTKLTGRLRASTQAWILVPRPPRERPSP